MIVWIWRKLNKECSLSFKERVRERSVVKYKN